MGTILGFVNYFLHIPYYVSSKYNNKRTVRKILEHIMKFETNPDQNKGSNDREPNNIGFLCRAYKIHNIFEETCIGMVPYRPVSIPGYRYRTEN